MLVAEGDAAAAAVVRGPDRPAARHAEGDRRAAAAAAADQGGEEEEDEENGGSGIPEPQCSCTQPNLT